MTPWAWNHTETTGQIVAGTVVAQVVLWCFGIPLGAAAALNVVMTVLMYLKTYYVRSIFDRLRR